MAQNKPGGRPTHFECDSRVMVSEFLHGPLLLPIVTVSGGAGTARRKRGNIP